MVRRHASFVLVCGCLVFAGRTATAQTGADAPLPARPIASGFEGLPAPTPHELEVRMRDVRRWMADYQAWKDWSKEWINQSQPGWFGNQDRKPRPDPPTFLADDCAALVDTTGTLADACRMLVEWREDYPTATIRAEMTAMRKQAEAPTKSMWWEHIHFDGLWSMTQTNASVYGLVGMHATVEVAGRFQVFIAPGALLLNVPTAQGTRELRPASDWGIAYRLFDFRFPGSTRRGSVHLNLVKAWVFAGPANAVRATVDMAGFSVTLKKTPTKP